MPSEQAAARRWLLDIAYHIGLALRFAEDLVFDAFCADQRTVYAVTRCLVECPIQRIP